MSMEKTASAARGKWRGILTTLGIDPKFLDGKHHGCPFCGGKDRFRFDDKDGHGTYFCSGCKPGSGLDFVMNLRSWDFARAAKEVDALVGQVQVSGVQKERTDQEKRYAIRRLLKSASPVMPGCPSWRYLERRCGDPSGVLHDLRHHPSLKHGAEFPGSFPALLGILRYPDGTGASVHRTYLTLEGRKAAVDPVRKIMSGSPLEGSAVRLGAVQERLGIAEGIETAVCAGKIFGLPVWAAISANGILSWTPPEGVKSVVIFGDNDTNKSYEGQVAAFEKAKKLRLKGFDVDVVIPALPGQDWADVWAESHPEGGA